MQRPTFRTLARTAAIVVVLVFALIGMVVVAVFMAMRFDLLNVRGASAARDRFFTEAARERTLVSTTFATATHSSGGTIPPAPQGAPDPNALASSIFNGDTSCPDTAPCSWERTREWYVVESGLRKDAPVLLRVAEETGVPARLIAAAVVPEQLRFFTAEREVFKRYFEPMKLLGTLSQFSLGVSGIKEETARAIEAHAASTTSPFYPGPDVRPLIAYAPEGARHNELFERLTDEHDHYYSYLYTALFMREIEAQWARSGYDLDGDVGTLVTLFNIGFDASEPKASPTPGGAQITVGGTTYTYGELGARFFASNALTDVFPR